MAKTAKTSLEFLLVKAEGMAVDFVAQYVIECATW